MNLPHSRALANLASIHFTSNTLILSAALATIFSFAAALFISVQSFLGSDFIVEWILHRSRNRTIHKALRKFPILNIYIRIAEQYRRIDLRKGVPPTVEFEIKWLTLILNPSDRDNLKILEMHGVTDCSNPEIELYRLSEAYEKLSQRLNARVLLTSNRVLANQQEQAALVSKYLQMNANFRSAPQKRINPLWIENTILGTKWELINPRINFSPSSHIDHVSVVHEHERVGVDGFALREVLEPGVTTTLEKLDSNKCELTKLRINLAGRDFDGVLPARRSMYMQQDPFSGHLRLLLDLSEITYSAVRVLNYVGNVGVGRSYRRLENESKDKDRLLSLAMLPMTSDGYLMLAKRSPFVTTGANKYSTAVTGNLELRDRLGLKVDRDEFGFPDPLAALAREAEEEMALVVDRNSIQVIGFSKFSSHEEVGTWVLLTSVLVQDSADRFVARSRHADQIEGAWETTGEFLALLGPRDRITAVETIRWAINTKEVTPPVTLALLAMSIPFLWVKGETTISKLESEISALITDEAVPRPAGSISDFRRK